MRVIWISSTSKILSCNILRSESDRINYKNDYLGEDPKTAQKAYGSRMENKLTQRVGELVAATSLLDIKYIPSARLHRLQGARISEYAVDLVHPYRLVFTPVLQEGGDITKLETIKIIRIEEVTDYHGKQNG